MKNRKVSVLVTILLIASMAILLVGCTNPNMLEKKFKDAGYEVKKDVNKSDLEDWNLIAYKKKADGILGGLVQDITGQVMPDITIVKFKKEQHAKTEELNAKETINGFINQLKDYKVERKGSVVYYGKSDLVDFAIGKKTKI